MNILKRRDSETTMSFMTLSDVTRCHSHFILVIRSKTKSWICERGSKLYYFEGRVKERVDTLNHHNAIIFFTEAQKRNLTWPSLHGKGSDSIVCVWRGVDFPTLPSSSQNPAGCPTIQHNSDTIYPERLHRLRAQSHQAALHFRCQLQVQVVTCTSNWLAI